MKKIAHVMSGIALAATLSFGATEARADETGYVCSLANRIPTSSTDDQNGSLVFSIYSGPDCTGMFLKTYVVQTGTAGGVLYTPPVFDRLFHGLLRAVAENIKVTAFPFNIFGNTQYLYYVTFYAN